MSALLSELNAVRHAIKRLEDQETELVNKIIEEFHHTHTGQKTYESDDGRKVTITTKNNVTVDKSKMNAQWDNAVKKFGDSFPINRSYAYTPRAKDLDACMSSGSVELRKLLADVITVKPAKQTVKIEG